MVNQASIQAKIAYGFSKAATVLGGTCGWWRPGYPLARASFMGTITALIDTDPALKLTKPKDRTKPESWYAAFGSPGVMVGDYIVDAVDGTFFVTVLNGFTAARMVSCNQTVDIYRPVQVAPGVGYYGGDVPSGEAMFLTDVPAAILQGAKGTIGEANLPGDTKLPMYAVLLPICNVQIRTGDIMIDNQVIPGRYTISSAEQTSMGWRLAASLATP